jgi:putative heme-binding domain-containing protein
MRHLMLAMGDISTNEARRRIDAGYTANKPDALSEELRRKALSLLTVAFDPQDPGHPQQYEIARLLAMLKADTSAAMEGLASALSPSSHPTHDAHYLFCLSQMPGPREIVREKIAKGFLGIDHKLEERDLLTDRNWSVNLRDALKTQLEFDPGTADRMAQSKKISPASVHLLSLLPEKDHRSMAQAMASGVRGWNREALGFVEKHLPPSAIPPLLTTLRGVWKSELQLRPDLVGFLSRHGSEEDRRAASEFQQPPTSKVDLTPFAEKMKIVDWEKGDSARGQATYTRYSCATCHSGNRRLGPSLGNIAKRFNREDIFRHINEPNLSLSDLYKATQITTADGVYIGMKVYSSEAQTILETGSNETIRFSRHDILSERSPNRSPMPAGLLLGASTQELADLYAYLKTL